MFENWDDGQIFLCTSVLQQLLALMRLFLYLFYESSSSEALHSLHQWSKKLCCASGTSPWQQVLCLCPVCMSFPSDEWIILLTVALCVTRIWLFWVGDIFSGQETKWIEKIDGLIVFHFGIFLKLCQSLKSYEQLRLSVVTQKESGAG